jgi:integrase
MATGIRRRHSAGCRAEDGDRCDCKAGWEAAVFDKREGRKIRRTFATKAEASDWRADRQIAKRSGSLRSPSKQTLREAAEEWLAKAEAGAVLTKQQRPYKPSTIRGYREGLRLRVLPDLGALALSEIRRSDVQDLVDRLLGRGENASTIRNTLDPLRAIFRWAEERELVERNPTTRVKVPKAEGRRDRIAPPEEAEKLLDALPVEDRPIWATAIYAGLRRGELRALRCAEVDLAGGVLRVVRSWDQAEGVVEVKSDAGRRTVPIPAVLRDVLDEHLLRTGRSDNDLIFGRTPEDPFVPSTVRLRAIDAWEDAGMAAITLHECRHSYASLMIAAGVNAKALSVYMGHASIEITYDRYGHLMPGNEAEAAGLLDRFLIAAGEEAARAADPEKVVA